MAFRRYLQLDIADMTVDVILEYSKQLKDLLRIERGEQESNAELCERETQKLRERLAAEKDPAEIGIP